MELRTEQMLRERKEKTETYFSTKTADSKSISTAKETQKPAKKQIKLPSSDLLYLNHEFDDLYDFHAAGAKTVDSVPPDVEHLNRTERRKPMTITANYDHVKSVVSSQKSASDLHSKKNRSQFSGDGGHDSSAINMESKTSLVSEDGLIRTSKIARRKVIETRFKNPLERELMEMMEEDIDRLSESTVFEQPPAATSVQPYTETNFNKSKTWLLDQQVRSLEDQFSRDQEVKYNSFLRSKIEDDLETASRADLMRRDHSPMRAYSRDHRSNSPGRRRSPVRTAVVQPSNRKAVEADVITKPRVENTVKNTRASSIPLQKDGPIKAKEIVRLPANAKPAPALDNQDFISVQDNRHQVTTPNSLPSQSRDLPSREGNQQRHGVSQKADASHNKTRGSHFLKSNKYTNQENYAIIEESSDNPFDKFDRNAQAHDVD